MDLVQPFYSPVSSNSCLGVRESGMITYTLQAIANRSPSYAPGFVTFGPLLRDALETHFRVSARDWMPLAFHNRVC